MSQPQLEMECLLNDGLPDVPIPPGYLVRAYRPGDGAVWCDLVNEVLGHDWSEDALAEEMARAEEFELADLIFAVSGDEIVGTSWALRREGFPRGTGAVHMVAVVSAHRGRGLGRSLVLSVLQRLSARGLSRAVLTTDDFRLPAIRLYLSLAFQPKITHESHPDRWRTIHEHLTLRENAR